MPLRRTYPDQECTVAATLEIVGERWSLLIVRSVMLGARRFDEIRVRLGIATNVLQTRLERLEEDGILERRLYQEHPPRHEYRLTEKGLALWPVIAALASWGDTHLSPAPPLVFRHRGCGGAVDDHRICTTCDARLEAADVFAEAGPGASADHPLRRSGPQALGASRDESGPWSRLSLGPRRHPDR